MERRIRYYYSGINFIILLIIFSINTLFLKDNFEFCKNYLNDILAMPFLLCYSDILFIYANKEKPRYFSLILFVLCSIIWEGIMPLLFSWSTADVLDILAYFIGTVIWNYRNYKVEISFKFGCK